MANYNELNALIDAYIHQNGVRAITGQILNGVLRAMVDQLGRGYSIRGAAQPSDDPGTPDGPEAYFATTPGVYPNFGGATVEQAEIALLTYDSTAGWQKISLFAGIADVDATIDANVGTPAVTATYQNGVLTFDFRNLKGEVGDPAGFGTVAATVDAGIGTPGVSVQTSGPATAKNLTFAFTNLKGETGVTSVVATVDNTTGNPSCVVSLQGQQLTLAFSGLKGAQGDTGVSADYPIAIVNNLTTDDPTSALSAAQGVVLQGEIGQLEAKVDDLQTGKYYGYFAKEEDLPETGVDGFAYVGQNSPYTIYNLRDGVWTSSNITVNQSPIGNDEDINQNEAGKLQFANRVYNTQQPNGMGYKILRKDATFASQVTDTNTIYEIRYDFNLGGTSFSFPANVVLYFNGGSITNGTLTYNNTNIRGKYSIDCSCSGILTNDVVSPKMYGAKGDGVTDDTNAFDAVKVNHADIYVEAGDYVLDNFTFSGGLRWEFQRAVSHPWWSNGAARILTSTGIIITNSPKIYNLVLIYNGNEDDLSQRPCGLYMRSHWAELHNVFVSYFRIGMAFGDIAGAHCDYTRIHNMQSWYNYFAGVYIGGTNSYQVNFISFFDCNVGSNGVSPHDSSVQPDTSRGYGFYISTANSIYINNADVSSNETCGIYIDSNSSTKVMRGLCISTIYAEHNKYCDIYFNNGQNSSATRPGEISITDAYFSHDSSDQFYVGRVYAPYNYAIYPCVKLLDYPVMRLQEGWYHALRLYQYGMPAGQDNRMSRAVVTLLPNKKYKLVFTIMPKETGNITLQWIYRKMVYSNSLLFYNDVGTLSTAVVQNIPVTADVEKVFEIYLETPSSDTPFVNWCAGGYGKDSVVTGFYWEDLTNKQISGITANRPAVADVPVGCTYFDTTLGKMIVSNGTAWVNMDGTALS